MSTTSTYKEYGQVGTMPKDDLDKHLSLVGLPSVSAADNGKVLKVVDGQWELVTIRELPEVDDSDNGKVLMVSEGEFVLSDIPAELPVVTGDDDGKVLMVVDGEWSAYLEE